MTKTKSVPSDNVAKAELNRKRLLEVYKSEPTIARSISPLYKPYMGKMIQISVNGITIYFPVDGSVHQVPESFATEIDSRIEAINATILKSQKMSNIAENHETFAGEIKMF